MYMETRLKTFLSLCETLNYRKTAELVNLTQPAVTKQIQSLQEEYGVKLFEYVGRALSITEQGLLVKQFAQSQFYNEAELLQLLGRAEQKVLRLGATKSIGDSVLDAYLQKYLEDERHNLSLTVANTTKLFSLLENSELDFIVVEGLFEKKKYDFRLLRRERFVGICAKDHPFAGKTIPFEALKTQNLFLREPGSGTRNIFERELESHGYDLSLFKRVTVLSSFQPLKKLVSNGLGISFVYQSIADSNENPGCFTLENMTSEHEFTIVWLKHTTASHYVDAFFMEKDSTPVEC
ncbi:MAG: LysR family transcriptional regulator [Dehalobacter sp. 4CP]|nr:LysR family transcriptional regulator [Dehalobacter sp. 4CP]